MCFTAYSVFEVANRKAGKALYDLHVLTERGGTVTSSFGMNVSTEPMGTRDFDTLMITVGMDVPSTPPGIASYLRRLASFCLGSFVLGEAGLLKKRRTVQRSLRSACRWAL